ncbi:RagB/SusD family nutrient uptake outer membrane protein [Zobellia roscoffensis]|uniref:RagB/SusD family nutrient uptake outer membrane protein n=1 Tax=Zobellia roscoffensis TaxID=2779508 RepID=UPI00188A69D2|nr:RagB/SusD family nutrient uptake outer membrane protein [Zobellia roscoffensis]
MKKIVSILALGLAFATSCSDDFLDKDPTDQLGASTVFEDQPLAQAFLNNIVGQLPAGQYNSPGAGYGNNYLLASISDEARSKSGWVPSNNVVRVGALNPLDLAGLDIWDDAYTAIRQANEFLASLEASEFDDAFKTSAEASARYVRAWFYFDLTRRYGDVPLLTVAQALDDEDLFPSQTPRSEIYTFVNQELTAAAAGLPNKSEAKSGELTKQAAIALNSRAMLFAERYEDAAALADALISGAENDGLELYGANPASAEEATKNYGDLFLSTGGNVETIYEILFLPPERSHQFDRGNWPVRWRNDNGGQTDPTQELVDDFEMANGLAIEEAGSGYDATNPYIDRDPRFYASIFYHGSEFSEVSPSRGEPFIDMEWNGFNEGPGTVRDGNASITGYLVRKFVDPSIGFAPEGLGKTAWQEIRFAEILLIYAEAENEVNGNSAAVTEAVNRIRRRAFMPELPAGLSKEDMREKIRQERRIELVFENHRWFDLIRWDLATTVLNQNYHGIKIERNGVPGAGDNGPQHVFDPAQLTFTVFEDPAFSNVFPDKYKFLPIPQDEMDANTNLKQNPGY